MTARRAARSGAGWIAAVALACPVQAAPSADERAARVVADMTQEEKLRLVFGYFATDFPPKKHLAPKEARRDSAGYVPGVPRAGLPPQWQADAGIGVATQSSSTRPYERTSLPSGLATAATWNPALAYAAGAMIGKEARLSGYNVMLAGGVNLMRDPRNGRNFEYAGEDPLLAGVMAGEQIRGIQSNHLIATVKHFAYNGQETNRFTVSSELDDAAARVSDLLAFQIAIERGDPGAVMCAYNRVNGVYACESPYLLKEVLKQDWNFQGYVMSDWGAVHSTIPAANAGLDQQSGWPFDKSAYFGEALGEAVANRHVPEARLDDMAHRIVRAMFKHGVMDHPVAAEPAGGIDFEAHAAATQAASEESIVLLKNSGALLPLAAGTRAIAIIGGHADKGVLSGGGSSQVHAHGGMAVPNEGPAHFPGPMVYHPSSPMQALAARSKARLTYLDGKDIAAAATLAAASDVAIVFATQWTAESVDAASLSLPGAQDELIAAVARANPRTVVVLETGGPVTMPWLDSAGAVLQAWYPGTRGGVAIARVLTGEVNPSGRLPATFPAAEAQLPRPAIHPDQQRADYNIEGAAVGYKWHDLTGRKPLFAFGHGLSYTSFAYGGLAAQFRDGALSVSFMVKNTGPRAGKAVPQVYLAPAAGGWEAPKRLGGWDKLALQPGASASTTLTVDPRLLGVYHSASKTWRIADGEYVITLASAADAPAATVHVRLPAITLDVRGRRLAPR
ncbi:beta-glucosidase [Massilia sp. Root418]|uniref:beta-glucosidase n=1 Tax=Massilia sp. Root418 TaxID=1736532 RepID=UPI0006F38128|nr:glycoside hydrolase family 3 protein [Massilia sp. Root418]KQX01682.1 beta-glucosidase [Massilia sp. Root418]